MKDCKHTITLETAPSLGCDCHIDDECDCDSYELIGIIINGKQGHGSIQPTEEGFEVNLLGAAFTVDTLEQFAKECKVRLSCFGEIICNN